MILSHDRSFLVTSIPLFAGKDDSFTKIQKKFGVTKWPYVRPGIVKSHAHKALCEHVNRAPQASFDEGQLVNKIMQDEPPVAAGTDENIPLPDENIPLLEAYLPV